MPEVMEIKGDWVTDTIKTAVAACPNNPHAQLTILTRALALAGKSLGASKEELVETFERVFDAEVVMKRPKQ